MATRRVDHLSPLNWLDDSLRTRGHDSSSRLLDPGPQWAIPPRIIFHSVHTFYITINKNSCFGFCVKLLAHFHTIQYIHFKQITEASKNQLAKAELGRFD